MHSPWGNIYSIIKELGFSWHELLWKISWINVQMMIADAPRYKTSEKEETKMAESIDDFAAFM